MSNCLRPPGLVGPRLPTITELPEKGHPLTMKPTVGPVDELGGDDPSPFKASVGDGRGHPPSKTKILLATAHEPRFSRRQAGDIPPTQSPPSDRLARSEEAIPLPFKASEPESSVSVSTALGPRRTTPGGGHPPAATSTVGPTGGRGHPPSLATSEPMSCVPMSTTDPMPSRCGQRIRTPEGVRKLFTDELARGLGLPRSWQ